MFICTNVRRFSNCSVAVRLTSFKSYRLSLYDIVLWHRYLKGNILKLHSRYNRRVNVKKFFEQLIVCRSYGLMQTLFQRKLPNFDTV